MKILLVRNDNLGDLICTTPAIEALRKKYPNAQIDIVVNTYNYLGIRKNPHVDKIYIYTKTKHEKGWFKKLKALLGKMYIMQTIYRKKYDVCVVFRGTYSPYAEQFAKLSQAPTRIGVKNPKGEDSFTHHVELNNNLHEVEFCFRCLEPLGVKYQGEKLFFYVEDEVINKFKPLGIRLLIHISARKPENKFSFNKWRKIFNSLVKSGISVFFTASSEDYALAKELSLTTGAKFIHTKSLIELAGVIKNAKLFVTLEGGSMHLGAALGVKTMALFGSSPISRWHPWGYKELVIQHPSKVAENIDNDLIIEKINSLLN
ncbi:MAG: glycosyltransferase family 9 protein [Thermodesulfobacteria bacterium]|nr:glycosyltransferase family 9 protein [Thermodesulfobacteriota bacterium]